MAAPVVWPPRACPPPSATQQVIYPQKYRQQPDQMGMLLFWLIQNHKPAARTLALIRCASSDMGVPAGDSVI